MDEGLKSCWDFRSKEEREASDDYIENGYNIFKINEGVYHQIRSFIVESVNAFLGSAQGIDLGEVHNYIDMEDSNKLRLHVLRQVWSSDHINRLYFEASRQIVETLCGNELAMQKKIGLSMQLPHNQCDALPVHSDTWNGVSPYDLNILMPLVNCKRTKSLYILERKEYVKALKEMPGLLSYPSEEIFEKLKDRLSWIEIDECSVLAFDQTLPHGFSVNEENDTHWSLNCRFKSLFTPYSDKLLGEYFMPITTKACTIVGINYEGPKSWLNS